MASIYISCFVDIYVELNSCQLAKLMLMWVDHQQVTTGCHLPFTEVPKAVTSVAVIYFLFTKLDLW